MTQPRLLLIGKIGQVGWELRRTLAPLGRLICVDYPEIDFTGSYLAWLYRRAPSISRRNSSAVRRGP